MATNIPLGTYISDGVRSGPFYSGQLPATLVADGNGVLTSSSHDNYGPGVLFSPQNTWNITPFPGSLVNLVAQTAAAAITGAGNLTLFGDTFATTYVNTNGIPYIQFDWPRVPTVTITNARAAAGTRVTIFGTDWYGMPLQHTYVLNVGGTDPIPSTYPVITNDIPITLSIPAKAFYTVNRVYIDRALGIGATISLGASNIFGLPFFTNFDDITSIGWDSVSDLGVIDNTFILKPIGGFVAGDTTNTTTLPPAGGDVTGDVRGLYGPSSPVPNGTTKLKFTSYVSGADVWQNQVANMQQLAAANGQPVFGVQISPLNSISLYGQPQFYTGNPS